MYLAYQAWYQDRQKYEFVTLYFMIMSTQHNNHMEKTRSNMHMMTPVKWLTLTMDINSNTTLKMWYLITTGNAVYSLQQIN